MDKKPKLATTDVDVESDGSEVNSKFLKAVEPYKAVTRSVLVFAASFGSYFVAKRVIENNLTIESTSEKVKAVIGAAAIASAVAGPAASGVGKTFDEVVDFIVEVERRVNDKS